MATTPQVPQNHASSQSRKNLPPILTVEELADLLRIDRKTAYAAIAEGGVPGVRRIGRCIRISRDVVFDWLDSGQGRELRRGRAS